MVACLRAWPLQSASWHRVVALSVRMARGAGIFAVLWIFLDTP
jgi:hypothetical protein